MSVLRILIERWKLKQGILLGCLLPDPIIKIRSYFFKKFVDKMVAVRSILKNQILDIDGSFRHENCLMIGCKMGDKEVFKMYSNQGFWTEWLVE